MNLIESRDNMEYVHRFRGDYEFLSNFYPAKLIFDGIPYYHAEAAYQAQKCADPAQRRMFSQLYSDESKRMGRTVPVREDWDAVKISVMEQVVRAKFEQNPRLAALLLATGEMVLLEGNTWHDVFWGVDLKTGQGENHLGRILMALREDFRKNGVSDRSYLRPLREYALERRLMLTDEATADVPAACIVREAEGKLGSDRRTGDAWLTQEPLFQTPCAMTVAAPTYGKDEETLLEACYTNALEVAAANRVESIAFPAIGVGKKCFPKRKAAQIAVKTLKMWLAHNPEVCLRIWLVPEDPRIFGFVLEEHS